eukprot:CAMPEP_0167748678 /NCGR_PEP_ID=MMETSP0110_2-20121227/4968_1 /TAXON_ID=629695 /ORGANISM="Gymnochlora sp., Strain CCMP2014" /LENGTH=281 /DNA_ID=CAMNT_0007633713 /DNA_START=520 /DNA_END=1362 /DNA_ORIENTATION=+
MAPVEFYSSSRKTASQSTSGLDSELGQKSIEVTEASRPALTSAAILDQLWSSINEGESPRSILHARGMQAINQAVKAIAVARGRWREGRTDKTSSNSADLAAFVRMHPREELTWACTLEVVPIDIQPKPSLQVGEIIEYNSSTHGVWIPGEVMSINEDGTVDLNIREAANPDRIRLLMEEIRVARTSEPDLVAKTIVNKLQNGHAVRLAAIGASSVHASILGIALGSLYLQDQSNVAEILFRPEFSTVELGSSVRRSNSKLVTLRFLLSPKNTDKALHTRG